MDADADDYHYRRQMSGTMLSERETMDVGKSDGGTYCVARGAGNNRSHVGSSSARSRFSEPSPFDSHSSYASPTWLAASPREGVPARGREQIRCQAAEG